DYLNQDREPSHEMRCGYANCLQNRRERIEAPGQLGEAMLHEAVADNQTQRDRGPTGNRRPADQIDREVAPHWRPLRNIAHRFHTKYPPRGSMSLLGIGRHCRLIEVFWTSCLLADKAPMPPPCPVLVVSVLVLVMRGGSGNICSAGVDALRYAGPSVIVRGFRPLRHCGRAGYSRQQSESRAGEQ